MEQLLDENRAELIGEVISSPEFSHKIYGESFFNVMLKITRKSGYDDCVPLMISEKLLWHSSVKPGDKLSVTGQVRTYNQMVDGHNHLMIVVFVKEMEPAGDCCIMDNYIMLEGYICKEPVRRTSPLGRELCDVMLAVNRMYNKSDYVPCIMWGRNAVYAGELEVGMKIMIEGRLQSRKYKKYDECGNSQEKTAYEVSVVNLETVM